MTKEQLTETRVRLYRATPLKLQLVDELISLIKGCFGDRVETNGIRFDSGNFKLGELSVNMIELDPQEIGGVLVHWSQDGKYSSVYMLKVSDIRRIIQRISKIHEHYNSHLSKIHEYYNSHQQR